MKINLVCVSTVQILRLYNFKLGNPSSNVIDSLAHFLDKPFVHRVIFYTGDEKSNFCGRIRL